MDIILFIIFLIALFFKKFEICLVTTLAMLTSFFGTSSNLMVFPFPHGMNDTGMISFFLLCGTLFYRHDTKLQIKPDFQLIICCFFLFVLVTAVVDLLMNSIDIKSIIRTSRHWLLLTAVFFFYKIPSENVRKFISLLGAVTVILTVLQLIDFYFNFSWFVSGEDGYRTFFSENVSYRRASIPSIFCSFYIFYFQDKDIGCSLYIRRLAVFSMVLLTALSAIRSQLIALAVGELIYLCFSTKVTFPKLCKYFIVFAVLGSIILSIPAVTARFEDAFDEFSEPESTERYAGNFDFRMKLLEERAVYVWNHPIYMLIGIGNVVEENFTPIFKHGLLKDDGTPVQLNTGDISWPLLLLRLGFIGTLLWLLFLLLLLRKSYFYRNMKYGRILFVFLCIQIFIYSFFGNTLANASFALLPLILLSYLQKESVSDRHSTINDLSSSGA